MSQYSRAVLHFLHVVANRENGGWGRVHAFTFGTRLTNITRHMAHRDVDAALSAAGAEAQDWEGGTRIAACLHAFNRDWSRRVMGRGAVVLLITDGLDRPDPGRGPDSRRGSDAAPRSVPLRRSDTRRRPESGPDTNGEGTAALGRAMERLHLSARRIVWLNPLLRWDGFAPKAAGIAAMLPHVDSLRAGHNIASLSALAEALSRREDGGEKARLLRRL